MTKFFHPFLLAAVLTFAASPSASANKPTPTPAEKAHAPNNSLKAFVGFFANLAETHCNSLSKQTSASPNPSTPLACFAPNVGGPTAQKAHPSSNAWQTFACGAWERLKRLPPLFSELSN